MMTLTAIMRVLLLSLAGLWFSQGTFARQITIFTEDYPPYNYRDANGEIVGEATSRVRAIMAETGLDYQLQLTPWARGFRLASTQPDTLIFSLAYSQERADAFDWLAPVGRPDLHLYVRKDLKTPVTPDTIREGGLTALCVETDASCNILRRAGFPETALVLTGTSGASEAMMVHYRRADVYLGDEKLHPYREFLYGVAASTLRPAMKVEEGLVFFLAAGTHVDPVVRDQVRTAYQALRGGGQQAMLAWPMQPEELRQDPAAVRHAPESKRPLP